MLAKPCSFSQLNSEASSRRILLQSVVAHSPFLCVSYREAAQLIMSPSRRKFQSPCSLCRLLLFVNLLPAGLLASHADVFDTHPAVAGDADYEVAEDTVSSTPRPAVLTTRNQSAVLLAKRGLSRVHCLSVAFLQALLYKVRGRRCSLQKDETETL